MISMSVVLSKEALCALAVNPTFAGFQFLRPVRTALSSAPAPSRRCRNCAKPKENVLSGPQQDLVLGSLLNTYAGEVAGLKRALATTELALPLSSGPLRI